MRFTAALALMALCTGAAGYGDALKRAERLPNLGRFLEAFVGDCESDQPDFDRAGCLSKASAAQQSYRGKVLLLEVDDASEHLSFSGWDDSKRAYRLFLTPFFSERALGLSVGKPSRLTTDGAPVVKNLPIWIPRPPAESDFAFRRQLERGMVRLELLFKPKGVWRLRRAGHEDVQGVEVTLVGLRVYPSRGQEILAEQMY